MASSGSFIVSCLWRNRCAVESVFYELAMLFWAVEDTSVFLQCLYCIWPRSCKARWAKSCLCFSENAHEDGGLFMVKWVKCVFLCSTSTFCNWPILHFAESRLVDQCVMAEGFFSPGSQSHPTRMRSHPMASFSICRHNELEPQPEDFAANAQDCTRLRKIAHA